MRFSNTLMLTTLFSCCVGASLHSQNNQWTWVSGNKIVDHSINYGTKGVAAATNDTATIYTELAGKNPGDVFISTRSYAIN